MFILESSELEYCQIQPPTHKNHLGGLGVTYKNRYFIKFQSYQLNQFKIAQKYCQQLLEKNETVIMVNKEYKL